MTFWIFWLSKSNHFGLLLQNLGLRPACCWCFNTRMLLPSSWAHTHHRADRSWSPSAAVWGSLSYFRPFFFTWKRAAVRPERFSPTCFNHHYSISASSTNQTRPKRSYNGPDLHTGSCAGYRKRLTGEMLVWFINLALKTGWKLKNVGIVYVIYINC